MASSGKRLCLFALTTCLASFACTSRTAPTAAQRYNVLYIVVDDLRPTLGCYGDKTAITPNIDRLAAAGLVFNRAYCQEAVCNPSRASVLTGRRPDTIRVWDLKEHFRSTLPDLVTLPQHFKNHGFASRSIGKVLHGQGAPAKDPPSWSIPPLYDIALEASQRYATRENLQGEGLKRSAVEAADVPDSAYVDGLVCDEAVKALSGLKSQGSYFLAVGFRKPHLPFCAPKQYWDLYDAATIPPPASRSHPQGAPELAVRSWQELEGYRDIPADGRLSEEQVAQLRHGYYACVSYVDALVGRLLDELEELGLSDNTIVCLWGDHGYQLGEQGLWTKSNNYELATRVPLIVAVPGRQTRGLSSDALVEMVDLYPTLVDLCGLPMPPGLEGVSLKPLFDDPGRSWKDAALSQFPRDRHKSRHQSAGDFMGYAIRSDQYRYVEWRAVKTREVVARELYDHAVDPHEMENRSGREPYAGIERELAERLSRGHGLKEPGS